MFWKNPFEELAQWKGNKYGEEDGDLDIGDCEKLNMVTENRYRNDVHLKEMTVL